MDMLLIIFSLTDMKHDILLISAKSLNELCINISDLLISLCVSILSLCVCVVHDLVPSLIPSPLLRVNSQYLEIHFTLSSHIQQRVLSQATYSQVILPRKLKRVLE